MPAGSLTEAYARTVADDSSEYFLDVREPFDQLHVASHDIGAACMLLAHDPPLTASARIVLDKARRDMDDAAVDAVTHDRYRKLLLRSILPMLDAQGHPRIQEAVRPMIHDAVIGTLGEVMPEAAVRDTRSGRRDGEALDALGDLTELTALALVTRLNHPRLLAMPALPHQDKAEDGYGGVGNFDFYVFESPAAWSVDDGTKSEAGVYRVQVKSDCLAYCGTPELPADKVPTVRRTAEARQQHAALRLEQASEARKGLLARERKRERMLDGYLPDIILVSGCCDLSPRGNGADHVANDTTAIGNRSRFTAHQLIREYEGKAGWADIAWLDSMSNGLLLSITSGGRARHGNLQGEYWK